MEHVLLIRVACLYLPLTGAIVLWLWRRPAGREATGVFMACLWNAALLPVLHAAALHLGWWRFEARGGFMLGFPVDLYLGWILLWGAIATLVFRRTNLTFAAAFFFALDLLLMPQAAGLINLGRSWLTGEIAGILICLLPGQMLARWTRDQRYLKGRAILQVVIFSVLAMAVLPALIMEQTHKGWLPLAAAPTWQLSLWFQLLMIPAVLGLSAVQEFVQRGGGTPIPYDPPVALVTSGPYAYVRNPMQLAAGLTLLLLGIILRNYWVAAAGLMAHIYSAGLARWDEGEDLAKRFGSKWLRYRAEVRNWWPRWRPWYDTAAFQQDFRPAKVYIAESCDACSPVAVFLRRRNPLGLEIVAAERYPYGNLRRMTYAPGDGGREEKGIVALARALEHIHLGWAVLAFAVRLPVVRDVLQLLVDACGGGEREIVSPVCQNSRTS